MKKKNSTKKGTLNYTDEEIKQAVYYFETGVPTTEVFGLLGWVSSTYYRAMKRDAAFNRRMKGAQLRYHLTLHETKLSMIQKENPIIVKHELTRMQARSDERTYLKALKTSQERAISLGDFELAQLIQTQINHEESQEIMNEKCDDDIHEDYLNALETVKEIASSLGNKKVSDFMQLEIINIECSDNNG